MVYNKAYACIDTVLSDMTIFYFSVDMIDINLFDIFYGFTCLVDCGMYRLLDRFSLAYDFNHLYYRHK